MSMGWQMCPKNRFLTRLEMTLSPHGRPKKRHNGFLTPFLSDTFSVLERQVGKAL